MEPYPHYDDSTAPATSPSPAAPVVHANSALATLFLIMAILAVAGVARSLLSNLLSSAVNSFIGFASIDITTMYIYSFINLFIANGVSIASSILLLPISRKMPTPAHRTMLRVGGIISILSIGVYLLYMFIQTILGVISMQSGIDDSLYGLIMFFSSGSAFSTFLALLMPAGKVLCAACFVGHPKPAVKTLSIITLASIALSLLLNLIPFQYNPIPTTVSSVIALSVGIVSAIFFFMVSRSYRAKELTVL